MNPQAQFCPNPGCHASGQVGGGNIITQCHQEKRYQCTCCGKTISERVGTSARSPPTQPTLNGWHVSGRLRLSLLHLA